MAETKFTDEELERIAAFVERSEQMAALCRLLNYNPDYPEPKPRQWTTDPPWA
jgi:hypothetical protein